MPGELIYIRQQEPMGLGHAVWCARHIVGDEPFAVMLVDDLIDAKVPCLAQMVEAHSQTGGNIVAVRRCRPSRRRATASSIRASSRIGWSRSGASSRSRRPSVAPSRLAVIGRYVLMPEIFGHLDRHEVGAGGEIQLTDAMAALIGSTPFHGLRFEGDRFDCGDKLGYLEAIVALAIRRPELAEGMRAILRRHG